MFNRLLFYTELTFLDLRRLWKPSLLQIIIVSGICLPVLLLLGLKNGHVDELRKDLEKSPSGRQITFGTGRTGKLLTTETLKELQNTINKKKKLLEVMFPDSYRQVALSNGSNKADSVTLYSTVPGDPLLKYYHVELPEYNKEMPGVALSQSLADKLNVKENDEILLHVERNADNNALRYAQTKIKVACIIATQGAEKMANESAAKIEKEKDEIVGYAPFGLLQDIERYVKGQQVTRYGWLSSSPPPRDTYAGYLLFTKKTAPLKEGDIEELQYRNFQVKEITDTEKNIKTLNGYLQDRAVEELLVYHLFYAGGEKNAWGELRFSPWSIMEDTSIDDAVIPWNHPLEMKVNEQNNTVVGVTLPEVWIKQYIKDPQYKFWTEDEESPYQMQIADCTVNGEQPTVSLLSQNENEMVLVKLNVLQPLEKNTDKIEEQEKSDVKNDVDTADAVETADDQQPPDTVTKDIQTVFVPGKLLAYFYAHKNGRATFDAQKNTFIHVPAEPNYTEFKAYAYTIDEVHAAADALRKNGYLPISNETQIDEIHQQNASLGLLVLIVGLGVFGFGMLTVVSVLYDSTERKRGTIGILRVMGTSKGGVFYFICLRSALIGLLAVVFTLFAGYMVQFCTMNDTMAKMLKSGADYWGWTELSGKAENVLKNNEILEKRYNNGEITWKDIQSEKQYVVFIKFNYSAYLIVLIGALFCCCVGTLLPAAIASTMDPFDAISKSRFK